MGRAWDYSVPSALVWSGIERVMKPAAPGLIFGGSRTFHRLVVAVEDGGLEPRDLLMWIYGSGFPKSLDVSKAIDKELGAKRHKTRTPMGPTGNKYASGLGDGRPWMVEAAKRGFHEHDSDEAVTSEAKVWDGYGTALKPSYEPVALVRKYTEETIARNVLRWGVGGLAIDASRLGRVPGDESGWSQSGSKASDNRAMSGANYERTPKPDAEGRWPPNVILDREAAAMLDAQSGDRPGMKSGGKHRASYAKDGRVSFDSPDAKSGQARGDNGGASRFHKVIDWEPLDHEIAEDVMRFFYSPKADRYQREAGLESRKKIPRGQKYGSIQDGRSSSGDEYTRPEVGNTHPTVKPVELIRYLARLILPPPHADGSPRRILVPYAGVSSEMIGCLQAGWDEVVGIEREAEYIEIAKARLTKGGVLSGLMDRKMRRRKL
jgi:site-specific DNA-methyltransferase (adenine-specific)